MAFRHAVLLRKRLAPASGLGLVGAAPQSLLGRLRLPNPPERTCKNILLRTCISGVSMVLFSYYFIVFMKGVHQLRSKVTRAGQITIPKSLREDIGLKIGDLVEFVKTPQGILLKPMRVEVVEFELKQD